VKIEAGKKVSVLKVWTKLKTMHVFEHWTPAMKLILFGVIEKPLFSAVEIFCISDTT